MSLKESGKNLERYGIGSHVLVISMKEFPFSVIGITETWLNSNSPAMFHLQDYEFLRADRSHGKGGGVGIYIHNQLKFKLRPDLHISGSEDIFIEIINSKSKNTIVGTIYSAYQNKGNPYSKAHCSKVK